MGGRLELMFGIGQVPITGQLLSQARTCPFLIPHLTPYLSTLLMIGISWSLRKYVSPFLCTEFSRPEASPGEETRIKSGKRGAGPFISVTATMRICIKGWKPFMVPIPTPSPVQKETKGVQNPTHKGFTYSGYANNERLSFQFSQRVGHYIHLFCSAVGR